MADKKYTWEGSLKWAKVHSPDEYKGKEFYSVNFYPKDNRTRREMGAVLAMNKMYEDDDGFWFRLKADVKHPPKVYDADTGDEIDDLIGNGSEAKVVVKVSSFKSRKFGEVTKAELKEVAITDLVIYEPEDVDEDEDDDEEEEAPRPKKAVKKNAKPKSKRVRSADDDDDESSEDDPLDFPDE